MKTKQTLKLMCGAALCAAGLAISVFSAQETMALPGTAQGDRLSALCAFNGGPDGRYVTDKAVRFRTAGKLQTADNSAQAQSCFGVQLSPSSNVQAAINSHPPGTTFCFAAGTYSVSALIPKSRDVFEGQEQQAVLDGGNSASWAFYGDTNATGPSNVTIEGFVIQNFNTPLQRGAIQDYNGSNWIIQNNHITNNAAAGVATGNYVQVVNNLIDWNGQEGYSAHGNHGIYQGNEIAYNNYNLAVDPTWEAGGGKAWNTRYLTFRSNYVHDNGGYGLWSDTNNIYTTYDSNTVDNNYGGGIYHEISYDATIINNTVTNNSMPSSPGGGQQLGYAWDAGIQLRRSQSIHALSPLLIQNNIVVNNFNGITLIDSPPSGCTGPGEGKYGECMVRNVTVQNNYVTMNQGASGGWEDGSGDAIFTTHNNHFIGNYYCVISDHHPDDGYAYGWFGWLDAWPDWSGWQGYGLDITGTYTIGGTCHP